jgi:hypothetical protein
MRGLIKETMRRGGEAERLRKRMERQAQIRRDKKAIITGLIRSWDLKEIKPPTREMYDTLQWFHQGLTIKYLRDLEKHFWS